MIWLIVPLSYGLLGVGVIVNSIYNAMDQPKLSVALILIRLFGLLLPLSWLGMQLGGLPGLFVGISLAYVGGGVAAYLMVHNLLDRELVRLSQDPNPAPNPEPAPIG